MTFIIIKYSNLYKCANQMDCIFENERAKDYTRSYDASAAAFVQHLLSMFSVWALRWQAKKCNERMDKWRCLCQPL